MTEPRTSALPPEPAEIVEELPALRGVIGGVIGGVIVGERGRQ